MPSPSEKELIEAAKAAYDAVKEWPEKRGGPMEVGGEGFMNLLQLRNMVPDLIAALERTGIPGEGNSSLRIGSPSPVPSNWRPIAELRRDLEWIMHFNGPGQINPAWLQIRMQKTLALLPSPPAAEDAQPSTERGEATPPLLFEGEGKGK
jgi:hypothetical protein